MILQGTTKETARVGDTIVTSPCEGGHVYRWKIVRVDEYGVKVKGYGGLGRTGSDDYFSYHKLKRG